MDTHRSKPCIQQFGDISKNANPQIQLACLAKSQEDVWHHAWPTKSQAPMQRTICTSLILYQPWLGVLLYIRQGEEILRTVQLPPAWSWAKQGYSSSILAVARILALTSLILPLPTHYHCQTSPLTLQNGAIDIQQMLMFVYFCMFHIRFHCTHVTLKP